jgi:hypothetical protein
MAKKTGNKMETLRIQINPKKALAIKKMAMSKFGFEKGAISKAVNEALDEWMKKEKDSKKVNWNKLMGVLSEEKLASVELQHTVWDTD